jgi:tRNA(Ile)-lysidine synthase
MTVAEVRERVRAGGLLPEGSAVVAMLSGGRDSVCLLDVAVALCGPERVRALHVNYGLRAESDGDERHCRGLCEQLGVELRAVRARRDEQAVGNLHAWARELRYGQAMAFAERHEALVASGHTASDQVETILYRLAASPGRRALLGMAASDGRLVRPLLAVTREQTAGYCRERGLSWREDVSNDSEQYARARVRHGLAKALAAVHPAAAENVLRTAELLREETELLDTLVDKELAGRQSIAIDRLEQLPVALQRLVVIRLAEDAAATFVPQAGERVGEILALGRRGGRAELHVGGLAGAVIENGELRMVKIEPRTQREPHGAREDGQRPRDARQ